MDVLPVIVEGLRAIAGFILLLLIPGFFLSLVFFPRLSDIRPIERLAYSAVLSICSVLTIVVVMDLFLGVNTTQRNVTLFILVFSIFAFVVWVCEIQVMQQGLKLRLKLPIPRMIRNNKYQTFPTVTYQMRFCTACGAKAATGNKFCGKCGAPLEENAVPAEIPAFPSIEAQPKPWFRKQDAVPAEPAANGSPVPHGAAEAVLSASPAGSVPPSEKVPPIQKGLSKSTLVTGAIALMIILSVVSLVIVPAITADHGATNAPVNESAVISTAYNHTIKPTPRPTIILPDREGETENEETLRQVYSLHHTFDYCKVSFNYTLTQPPLSFSFSLDPKMVNRSHLAGIDTKNEHWANVTTESPNAWFEVDVTDARTGEIVERQGYGIVSDLSDVPQQSFRIWKMGDYRINISGNDVTADLLIQAGTDNKEHAEPAGISEEFSDIPPSPEDTEEPLIMTLPSIQPPAISNQHLSGGESCGPTMKDEGLAAIADEPVFLYWFKDRVDSEGNTVPAPVSQLTSYMNSHTANESDFPAGVSTRISVVLADDPTGNLTSCELRNATKDYVAYLKMVRSTYLPALKGIERVDRMKYWANMTGSTDITTETDTLYDIFITIKGYASG